MTAFHAAFEAALQGDATEFAPYLRPDDRTPERLAVYRNTVIKGRIDALEANFPTVLQMVGPDWFRAAARAFIEEQPGGVPALADYGAGFPDWLARFGPADDMPYLPVMARLDRAWTEAHLAPDAAVLTAAAAAGAGPALVGMTGVLHPSARLFWFEWTAPSLWLAHRYADPGDQPLIWRPQPEGLLICRPAAEVAARGLDRAEWAFLDACARGRAFGVAAAAAAAVRTDLDLPALFAGLIALGAFAATPEQP